MKSTPVKRTVLLDYKPTIYSMKKYVILTLKDGGEVNVENLDIGGYHVSRPFEWKELQGWIEHLMNRRRRLNWRNSLKPQAVPTISKDEVLRRQIMQIVESNIANPDFCIEVFAREAGMSTTQLYRRVIALTGFGPNDLMRHMRLQRAADLLTQQAGNVSEVGYRVGFNSLSYFSKCFKEKFGSLPSTYGARATNDLET